MQIITDLQIHSKYSRATSPRMDLFEMSYWAAKKGIDIITTGDWTHPLYFREIRENLKQVNDGVYTLKNPRIDQLRPVNFILTTEVSSIYSQGGKVRRVHNLIFSPSIETCQKIIDELIRRGAKLMSDGRPIVGLSSKEVMQLSLEIDSNILFIPAHAWTPWFSLYGSKSGFDSIEECFEELAKYIYAIETGLSSDPIMNWQIADLNSRSILSFSDAHSGPKLGREATVFTCNMKHETCNINYKDFADAIKQIPNSHLKIGYTIEFFPEEGKYHWSGHRSCNVRLDPQQVKQNGIICPKCKKPMTIGVENRVLDLSSRTINKDDLLIKENNHGVTFIGDKDKKRRPFVSLIPLQEILNHVIKSPSKAIEMYDQMISTIAPEFEILLKTDLDTIEKNSSKQISDAIELVRKRKVSVDPGYDGVFGTIKIFENHDNKKEPIKNQQSLF